MKTLLVFLACIYLAVSAPASAWRGKTIYQVLTDRFARTSGSKTPCLNLNNYCGGTFQGLTNNLAYIKGMGFDAIWISPVPVNAPNGYHGYFATDWYNINPHFGTSQDLLNLVKTAHSMGLWIMLDVVANHVGSDSTTNFSNIIPFNTTSNYHPYCEINNWNNQTEVEFCRLANLADLKQEDPTTASLLLNWVKNMTTTYGFDGLRVDTVCEVPKWFWDQYRQYAGVYQVGEVFNGDLGYCAGYQGHLDGILNYPLFFTLRAVFQSGQSMNNLQSYFQAANAWPDQTLLGNFLDNHDNPRFLYQNNNIPMFKAALAFTLSAVGIPIIYYGDEQEFNGGPDPKCREPLWGHMDNTSTVYQYIATINSFRKQSQFAFQPQIQRWSDDNFYAFTRGQYFFAFTNTQNEQVRNITYHPYKDGTTLCNLFYSTDCVNVANGQFPVYLVGGEVKIFYPKTSEEDIFI